MKYTGEEKKIPLTPISIARLFLLFIVTVTTFGIALFPIILSFKYVFQYLDFSRIIHLFIFSIILILDFLLFILSTIISSAFFINILDLKYKEGKYGKSLQDKTAFKFTLYYALYHPAYKLINIFNLTPLKPFYLRLIGCKIGKNVFLAGEEWIIDPSVTEIGENTMIGGKTILSAHLAEEKLIVKKIKIGKNCLIGGQSLILPGAIIEDNVVLGAKSLVTKNQILKKGKTYAGNPAKEIKKKNKKTI